MTANRRFKEETKMKAKTKKVLTGIGALTLTAVISIGGTFAYLTKLTEKRANNFTFASKGLNAMLTEPEWDGVIDYEYDENDEFLAPVYEKEQNGGKVYGYFRRGGKLWKIRYTPTKLNEKKNDTNWNPEEGTEESELKKWLDENFPDDTTITYDDYERPSKEEDDDSSNDDEDEYGYIEAQKMIPGQEAKKNPFITNTGDLDEWVAAKVTFVYADNNGHTKGAKVSDTDFAKIKDVIQIDWLNSDQGTGTWVYAGTGSLSSTTYASEMVFYYNKLLQGGNDVTAELFTTVTVNSAASNDQIKALEALGGFTIYIEGYATQADAYDANTWVSKKEATFESDNATIIDNTGKLGILGALSPKDKTTNSADANPNNG